MVRHCKKAALVAAVLILAVCATPAPAAKGVKKSGERQFRGTVSAVHRGNKGGAGTMTVRVTHRKRNKGQNVGQRANANQGTTQKTFNIDKRTRVQGGTNGKQNNLGALRTGERVTVFEHGRHADKVVIHSRKTGKRATRVTYHRSHPAMPVAAHQTTHRTTTAPVPTHAQHASAAHAPAHAHNPGRPATATPAHPAKSTPHRTEHVASQHATSARHH